MIQLGLNVRSSAPSLDDSDEGRFLFLLQLSEEYRRMPGRL